MKRYALLITLFLISSVVFCQESSNKELRKQARDEFHKKYNYETKIS